MKDSSKMGTQPVLGLIVKMSLPSMFSMIVQSLYNVVDSYFVAQLGEKALTAVSLAYPVQILMISVAVGMGVGVNSLMARRLGQGNVEAANMAANHAIFLAVIAGVLFAIFGALFPRVFFASFSPDPEIISMGSDYLSVVCIFSVSVMIQIAIERIFQATGNMIGPMIFMLIGAITNIILDPILIFGLCGAPALGIKGAAIATVVGQILACTAGIIALLTKSREIKVNLKGFRPKAEILRDIFVVGLPSILMQSLATVLTIGLNTILISFSNAAVSVLGAYFRLQSFVFMPVFGLTHGTMPLMGYNFGAGNRERVKQTLRAACLIALGIMLTGTLIFFLFTPELLGIFSASPEMLSIGVPALRIISTCFVPAAIGIMFSIFYQSIGVGVNSLIISLLRQLVLILPLAWVFSRMGLGYVWLAFPLAESVALVVNIILFGRVWKKHIVTLGEPKNLYTGPDL